MNNYICTGKGFVKSAGYSQEKQEFVIEYSDNVRNAQPFNTKAALKFMENHEIEGFVWKPFAQEPVRDMYEVRKIRMAWEENEGEMIQEWQPTKLKMTSDSDVGFLMSGKLKSEQALTFDEAKAEALRLNMEMMRELNDKIKELAHKTEL